MIVFKYIYIYIMLPLHGPWFGELELCFCPVVCALLVFLVLQHVFGGHMYIHKHAHICNVSNDIYTCHLTECARISDYWDNSRMVSSLFNGIQGSNLEESENIIIGNLEA